MAYLLLILFPLSMAASCFVLRRSTGLAVALAVATVLALAALVPQIPIDAPARMLGVTLILGSLSRLFLLAFLGVVLVAFGASWSLPHGENFVPVGLIVVSVVCAISLLQDPFLLSLLLVGANLAAVLAIVDLPVGASALVGTRVLATAIKYLVLTVIAGALMYLGFVLVGVYQSSQLPGGVPLSRFVLALLAAGFALRLAIIPFHGWLPDLIDDAAPLVSALVVAVLNGLSLLVLVLSLQSFPDLIADGAQGLLVMRIGGIVTAVLGGLLALSQKSLRRTLAYLLVYEAGMLLFGVAALNTAGLTGALFEVLNQALAGTLILVSLGLLELPDGRAPGVERRDLLRRWPVAGLGLLGGGLSLVGLPPFSGFVGKLLIFQGASEYGWWSLLPLALASCLACAALLRAARSWLLGAPEDLPAAEPALLGEIELDRPAQRRLDPEPRPAALLVTALLAICLGVGLAPQPLLALMAEVVRGLTFISAQ
jgi:formate hydrogenlyase subunit 3/multisubunit Na+/H+ antiporter MnhD subunit